MSPKSIIKFPILLIILFLILSIVLGIMGRHSLLNKYHEGVQLYFIGDYSEAFRIFHSLYGWGDRIVEITPEEYCEMIALKLDVKRCPECGAIIS